MDLVHDPNFRRSVVLMLEHEVGQGALGLIVNRRSDFSMVQLCQNLDVAWRGASDACVDWGGPVGENQGWVLMDDEAARGLEAVRVAPGGSGPIAQVTTPPTGAQPAVPARPRRRDRAVSLKRPPTSSSRAVP